jgi:hypothetical protein
MLTPSATYFALLIVQTAHLLHHRLVKRHISFTEVISSGMLCVPVTIGLPGWLFMTAHLSMIAVQIVGSIWIRRLSPAWETELPAVG